MGEREVQPRLNDPMRGNSCPELRAHVAGIGDHAGTAQIKPVCIPARPDSRVVVVVAIRVPNASIVKQVKMVIW